MGTVLWPHGPSLGPGCLPASSPHLSLRLSLLEISTPTVVLPTLCQEQAAPHKPPSSGQQSLTVPTQLAWHLVGITAEPLPAC